MEKKYECPECKKKFSTKQGERMHRRSTMHQIFKCVICERFCYSQEGLEKHVNSKHIDFQDYKIISEIKNIKDDIGLITNAVELNKYVGLLPRKMHWSYGSLRQAYLKIDDHIKGKYDINFSELKAEIISIIESVIEI